MLANLCSNFCNNGVKIILKVSKLWSRAEKAKNFLIFNILPYPGNAVFETRVQRTKVMQFAPPCNRRTLPKNGTYISDPFVFAKRLFRRVEFVKQILATASVTLEWLGHGLTGKRLECVRGIVAADTLLSIGTAFFHPVMDYG